MDSQMLFIPLRAFAEMCGWLFIGYALALGIKMLVYRGAGLVAKMWRDAGAESEGT